jgi:hypothetical protein
MQMDVLKTMFGGDKGPPTPPGIRMRGIFAAPTGFSAQFFPESVILGCGPDVARAYPYSVVADGTKTLMKIDAPDHPLVVAFRPDGSLDPGTGPYQVHGRTILGQTDDGDFKFAPVEQTCNLAVLAPSKAIPSSGGILRRSAMPLYPSFPDFLHQPAFPIHSPDVPTFCCAIATPAASAKPASPSRQECRRINM